MTVSHRGSGACDESNFRSSRGTFYSLATSAGARRRICLRLFLGKWGRGSRGSIRRRSRSHHADDGSVFQWRRWIRRGWSRGSRKHVNFGRRWRNKTVHIHHDDNGSAGVWFQSPAAIRSPSRVEGNMNKKLSLIFIIIAGVILFALMNRKTVAASSAPVNQPGAGSGGINFVAVDVPTGLPVFDSSAPRQFVRGAAPVVGGNYQCGNGTTPAVNAQDGQVYCVIPADAGVYPISSPVVAPVDFHYTPMGTGPVGVAIPTSVGPSDTSLTLPSDSYDV
jgi:hypothetical protein